MERESCEVCGYRSQLGAIEKHHILPTEVTEEAGVPASQTLRLCSNCHREVHTWYSIKVMNMVYDSAAKQIRDRSSLEMVKEYQAAFNSFVKHKNEPGKLD